MPIDYSLAKLYKIEPLNPDDETDVYIGSTCEPTLARRMLGHRRDYLSWKAGKFHYVSSFKLGRILNNYMNQQEFKTGKSYHNWLDSLPIVVKELNEIRDKKLPKDIYEVKYDNFDPATTEVKTTEEPKPKYIEINELFTC